MLIHRGNSPRKPDCPSGGSAPCQARREHRTESRGLSRGHGRVVSGLMFVGVAGVLLPGSGTGKGTGRQRQTGEHTPLRPLERASRNSGYEKLGSAVSRVARLTLLG